VLAESNQDLFQSYSNIVERKQAIKMFFPTGFTPNGDGINDVYIPKGRFVAHFKMYVYNQLGVLVYFTDNFQKGWTGENAVAGDYVIEVEASDTIGNTIQKKTTITLIK
jgi:gliding motility-associated-like protein